MVVSSTTAGNKHVQISYLHIIYRTRASGQIPECQLMHFRLFATNFKLEQENAEKTGLCNLALLSPTGHALPYIASDSIWPGLRATYHRLVRKIQRPQSQHWLSAQSLTAQRMTSFAEVKIALVCWGSRITIPQWQVGILGSALAASLGLSYPWLQVFTITNTMNCI